jgi:hypothetical protein
MMKCCLCSVITPHEDDLIPSLTECCFNILCQMCQKQLQDFNKSKNSLLCYLCHEYISPSNEHVILSLTQLIKKSRQSDDKIAWSYYVLGKKLMDTQPHKAIVHLKKAAAGNFPLAHHRLGMLYLNQARHSSNNQENQKYYTRSYQYFKIAVERFNDADAAYQISKMIHFNWKMLSKIANIISDEEADWCRQNYLNLAINFGHRESLVQCSNTIIGCSPSQYLASVVMARVHKNYTNYFRLIHKLVNAVNLPICKEWALKCLVLKQDQMIICSNCYKKGETNIVCNQCHVTKYCSRECLEEHEHTTSTCNKLKEYQQFYKNHLQEKHKVLLEKKINQKEKTKSVENWNRVDDIQIEKKNISNKVKEQQQPRPPTCIHCDSISLDLSFLLCCGSICCKKCLFDISTNYQLIHDGKKGTCSLCKEKMTLLDDESQVSSKDKYIRLIHFAESGVAPAQTKLGLMALNGHHEEYFIRESRAKQAKKWFELSACQNDPIGLYELGLLIGKTGWKLTSEKWKGLDFVRLIAKSASYGHEPAKEFLAEWMHLSKTEKEK